jgi:hypothetical protein
METQILELEKKYWQGMENHDYETVRNLTHFPCIVAGKNGVQSVDEPTFKKMFESGSGAKYKVLDITGVESQMINDNTAVIGYLIDIQTENGQEPMHCACTSTWLKENDNWVCALHTESELEPKEEHQAV